MPYFMKNRFRGFLPVVIDVETAGFDPQTDALLEIAAIGLDFNSDGHLVTASQYHAHVLPFPGARLDPKALAFTKIDPYHPFRFAQEESVMLLQLFEFVQALLQAHQCKRAVLVGHNPGFDLAFLQAAFKRHQSVLGKNPFHSFTALDTATLSALAFGQTVLAKACRAAGIEFDPNQAHSALYDAMRTAELFCSITNAWYQALGPVRSQKRRAIQNRQSNSQSNPQ